MKFAITIEGGAKVEDVTNYEDIKVQIINQLKNLQT